MGTKSSVYHARIIVSGKLENVPDSFRLIPGMELKAEIKVGKRRIIEYIIHPLIKALDESIREP
jgi:HlyD family secretion protein